MSFFPSSLEGGSGFLPHAGTQHVTPCTPAICSAPVVIFQKKKN